MIFLALLLIFCAAFLTITTFDYCLSALELAYISVTKKELALAVYLFLALSTAINAIFLLKR